MNDKTNNVYQARQKRVLESLKFQRKPEFFEEGRVSNIVSLKRYYGLSRSEKLILMPVFDEICFSENGDIAFARIEDMWNLFDAYTGAELIPDSMASIPIYNSAHQTLEIIVDENHHGLYDLNLKRLILPAEYDEVDCSTAFSHMWVRKGTCWGYVQKGTGRETMVDDMDMVYEADGGLFMLKGSQIFMIDERGVSDERALRRYVLSHDGRGVVRNAKYHETKYFDIYGYIL